MSELYPNQDLDLSLLNEIADGSDEFLIETIDMFLEQTPDLMTQINDSMEEMDWVAAAASAHKLKPTLGFFGMLNTQALIQDIELGCKSGNPDVMELISKYKQAKDYLDTNTEVLIQLKKEAEGRL